MSEKRPKQTMVKVNSPSVAVKISLADSLYQRDPEETELGRRIIEQGIRLIDKLGVEGFTFKKLADALGTTEASIYRYFENKHKLLVYLTAWYWAWLDYRMSWVTTNITSPAERLRLMMHELAVSGSSDPGVPFIDYAALWRIVMNESAKAYLTKQVDAENKEGAFLSYKMLCRRIAGDISKVSARYPYPRALAGILVESAHRQLFFAAHLPSLTDISDGNKAEAGIEKLLNHLLQSQLGQVNTSKNK